MFIIIIIDYYNGFMLTGMDPSGLNLEQLDLTSDDFILDEIGGK